MLDQSQTAILPKDILNNNNKNNMLFIVLMAVCVVGSIDLMLGCLFFNTSDLAWTFLPVMAYVFDIIPCPGTRGICFH
jgi:hypothetical protein